MGGGGGGGGGGGSKKLPYKMEWPMLKIYDKITDSL